MTKENKIVSQPPRSSLHFKITPRRCLAETRCSGQEQHEHDTQQGSPTLCQGPTMPDHTTTPYQGPTMPRSHRVRPHRHTMPRSHCAKVPLPHHAKVPPCQDPTATLCRGPTIPRSHHTKTPPSHCAEVPPCQDATTTPCQGPTLPCQDPTTTLC